MKIKYSLSNIFLLTALVGLIVGWWLDHRRLSQGYEHNRSTLVSLIASDTSQDTQNISILNKFHDSTLVNDRSNINTLGTALDLCLLAIEQHKMFVSSHLEMVKQLEVK